MRLLRPRDGRTVAGMEFAACYRSEMAALVRHVMFHGASEQEAHDAAQSAFEQAYRVWETIRSPRAWLRTVAVRAHLRSAVRQETPAESLPDRVGELSAMVGAESREQERAVLAALAALPLKQRQVMAWTFDGFAPAEIAVALDTDPAAVRQNLAKARRNLKQLLGIEGRDAR
jgi:RNA polymerase sigma factor (sigma-70 family)